MSSSALGSNEYTDVLRVRYANGGSDLFNIRLYISSKLGTDLSRGLSIEHTYIVCIMSRHSVSSFNSFPRHPHHDRDCSDSQHAYKQQPRYSSIYDSPATMDKISLPPIFPVPCHSPHPHPQPNTPNYSICFS
ncbi:MAG: hypothetical protein BYD32DRAFT_463312 [Podila humilis]|nr:MAG: hypothetical protein BYD32DRAFT_463312 [Podila humilis]